MITLVIRACCGQDETIKWRARFGDAPISRHFPNEQIERYTEARNSIIPYRCEKVE